MNYSKINYLLWPKIYNNTIISIIWMYTSILGNKQSTINRYTFFFFFPFHIQKGLGTQVLSFYHQISAWLKIFSFFWLMPLTLGRPTENKLWCKAKRKIERKQRVNQCHSWFPILIMTASQFLPSNAEKSEKRITVCIRTSAGRVRL